MQHTIIKFTQLAHLMDVNGIKNAMRLARAMAESGIIPVDPEDEEHIHKISNVINRHLKNADSAVEMSGAWLDRYCRFFHCSADYLLGYVDSPTYYIDQGRKLLGLSEDALIALEGMAAYNSTQGLIDTLSVLLEDRSFARFLSSVTDRISSPNGQLLPPHEPPYDLIPLDILYPDLKDEFLQRFISNHDIISFFTDEKLSELAQRYQGHGYPTPDQRNKLYREELGQYIEKYKAEHPDSSISRSKEYTQQ